MMQTKLDRFGRVVLPKGSRQAFGLEAGAILEVRHEEGAITLRPLGDDVPLKHTDGVLVYCGQPTGDLAAAAARQRDDGRDSGGR